MTRSPVQIVVPIALALVAGFAAVAVASALDDLATRIAMQALALVAVTVMLWAAASGDGGESAGGDTGPLSKSLTAALRSDHRLSTFDRDTGLCVAWYFRLRAEEEIGRATRFGQPFTVLTIAAGSSRALDGTRIALKHSLRQVDFAGDLGNKLAAVLPQTERAGAMIVAERLQADAPDVIVRVAEYPVDGATLSHLLGDDEWRTTPMATDFVA